MSKPSATRTCPPPQPEEAARQREAAARQGGGAHTEKEAGTPAVMMESADPAREETLLQGCASRTVRAKGLPAACCTSCSRPAGTTPSVAFPLTPHTSATPCVPPALLYSTTSWYAASPLYVRLPSACSAPRLAHCSTSSTLSTHTFTLSAAPATRAPTRRLSLFGSPAMTEGGGSTAPPHRTQKALP